MRNKESAGLNRWLLALLALVKAALLAFGFENLHISIDFHLKSNFLNN